MEVQSTQMSAGSLSAAQEQQKLGSQLVNQTLNKMNENSDGKVKSDFQMQKDVLTAGMTGKGGTINIMA